MPADRGTTALVAARLRAGAVLAASITQCWQHCLHDDELELMDYSDITEDEPVDTTKVEAAFCFYEDGYSDIKKTPIDRDEFGYSGVNILDFEWGPHFRFHEDYKFIDKRDDSLIFNNGGIALDPFFF
jgi:hypothetical protein